MRNQSRFIVVASISLLTLIGSNVSAAFANPVDPEGSAGGVFQAWSSRQWPQTTQADFEAGVLNNIDTSTNPGDARLASISNGTIASAVLDTSVTSGRWDALFWDKSLPGNSTITFEVRASDTSFAKEAASPAWVPIGGTSPVNANLPSGRYKQWRATMSSSEPSELPVLYEVRLYYE